MPRYLFSGGLSDLVVQTNYPTDDPVVRIQSGATCTVWSAATGGTQYTDLQLEYGGTPVTTLVTSATGRLPRFYGPDGIKQVWIETGDGDRYVLETTDLGSLLDNKLDATAAPAPHQHSGADVPSLQRAIDSALRVVMFDPVTNLWPYQADVTATYPPGPIFWRGNAGIPAQARAGLDYVDQLEATNSGGSTNIPDPTPDPDEEPIPDPEEPTQAVALSTPVVSVNGAQVTVSANVITTGGPQTFKYVQIAVRGPAGQNNDVGYRTDVSIDGTLALSGGFTAPASGAWIAYATYNKSGGSAQSDWVDGPKKTFTVTLPTPTEPNPGTGGGGTTPPVSSAKMPKIGRSGLPWNSGVAKWNTTTPNDTPNQANSFGVWRGRPVDGFLHFPTRQTWNEMFNQVGTNWNTWPGYIVYCIPPQPESEGGGSNSATAAGQNNARWEGFGQKLNSLGLNKATFVLRLGWENNGWWYKWAWGNEGGTKPTPNSTESFIAAVKNVSVSVKRYAPNIKISLNMTRGQKRAGTNWQQVYTPLLGNHQYGKIFDIIGYDTYDWYPATNAGNFDGTMRESPGFNDIVSFCRSNGLQIGVEEWGLVGPLRGGGGNNPYFINRMYEVFNSITDVLAFEGYYEDQGAPKELEHRLMPGYYPAAMAAYRAKNRFGNL